ncbi:MAG: RNA-binding cell elongation regulator Jag/EloR [Candidatus Binataceae bacterium]
MSAIEQTAPTVEEAIRQALTQLGAQEDDVTIEILSTPRSGVLGLGARQARVRVTRREPEAARSEAQSPPPAPPPSPRRERIPRPPMQPSARAPIEPPRTPAPARYKERPQQDQRDQEDRPHRQRAESEDAESAGPDTRKSVGREEQTREAIEVLRRTLELMGERCAVEPSTGDPETIELEIKGDGSGILIGRHGQTLDALEYIVNRLLARRIKEAATVVLDTESYRLRRRQQLHRMALSMGEQAKREHETVRLEPMAPRDRRIVHLALKDDPMITTRSSGDGYMRSIEIIPVGGPGPRRKGSPERERDEAVGEQGGFKHGQKRII